MNIRVSGNCGGRTVVFLSGWPDTSEVFRDNIMSALAPRYRLVGVTLPGFDRMSPQVQRVKRSRKKEEATEKGSLSSKMDFLRTPRMGYSFEDLVDFFEIALLAVMEHRPLERPLLVVHGWGCIIAHEFLLSRPYFFSRVVMLDVGGDISDPLLRKGGECNDGVVSGIWAQWWRWVHIFICHAIVIAAFLIIPTCVGKGVLRCILQIARRPSYKYTCHLTDLGNDTDGEEEVLMVPICTQKSIVDASRKSARFFNVFNALLRFTVFGGDSEKKQDVSSLAASFYPSQFYYAKSSRLYTLPPHPTANGIHYTYYRYRPARTQKTNGLANENNSNSLTTRNGTHSSTASSHDDEASLSFVDVDPLNGWIYLRYWMLWISRLLPSSKRFFIPISVPVLFLYGTEKPIMLHSHEWIKYIEAKGETDGSEVVSVAGGHWFFAEDKNKRQVMERIAEFLDADEFEAHIP
ncbi:hypothetical protein MOQ_006385 [Trypanosoma cruzi marinkellei]|uniref:AB hydrolase-1 domain-containing protein n=1 Tax=Trypanosoma cruzi marinkellei TaxID=85056 RepID=K2M4B8_TRYCR|nr:hypothetical protein MOQ_006385 [Trypanosoma cruzi marinkellei]